MRAVRFCPSTRRFFPFDDWSLHWGAMNENVQVKKWHEFQFMFWYTGGLHIHTLPAKLGGVYKYVPMGVIWPFKNVYYIYHALQGIYVYVPSGMLLYFPSAFGLMKI